MKECDVCNKLDKVHLELNLLTTKLGHFRVKIVGKIFLSKRTIVMAGRESLNCMK